MPYLHWLRLSARRTAACGSFTAHCLEPLFCKEVNLVCPGPKPYYLNSVSAIAYDTHNPNCGPQIDAYRFDIMGHLFLHTMRKIQAGLGELTLEQDGVNGSSIYVYGETWDFGEARPLCSCTDALHVEHGLHNGLCAYDGKRLLIDALTPFNQ